jgi:membrane protein CcdC involved in cytochrome C biogenesis
MKEFAPYIVPLIVAAIMIRRSMQARKVNTSRMWLRPVVLLFMLAGALAYAPMPGVIAIAAFLAAAAAGVALGVYMASHQHLTIDEETGHVSSRTSMIGTLLVLGLFAVRFGAKLVFPELANPGHSHSMMTQAANGLLVFTVAVLIAQTMSVWRRTQPMIAAHAARKLSGAGQPAPEAQPVSQPATQPLAEAVAQPTE